MTFSKKRKASLVKQVVQNATNLADINHGIDAGDLVRACERVCASVPCVLCVRVCMCVLRVCFVCFVCFVCVLCVWALCVCVCVCVCACICVYCFGRVHRWCGVRSDIFILMVYRSLAKRSSGRDIT